MQKVRVNKTVLEVAIRQNLEVHKAAYVDAKEGWEKAVSKFLKSHYDSFVADGYLKDSDGEDVRYLHIPEKPENHSKDYERVLKMLEMSTETEIELTQQDFSRYVMDEWEWKSKFETSTSAYTSRH